MRLFSWATAVSPESFERGEMMRREASSRTRHPNLLVKIVEHHRKRLTSRVADRFGV
jgi:hypothetical protein